MKANKLVSFEIERLFLSQGKTANVFSLQRIRRLLEDLGRPQDKLPPVIHIAGTNGKGSVTAFSRALLEESGLAVHVHTSPHLIKWNERFRLGIKGGKGKLVDDDILLDVLRRIIQANNGKEITTFEVSVATAFVLFSEYPADVAIIEVGLGGRLDATNVIDTPAVSVITSISLDHEACLGKTVDLIAVEKSAIMKSGCPVVIGYQSYEEVRHLLGSSAKKMGCSYRVYGDDFFAFQKDGYLVYQDLFGQMNLPMPNLVGEYQYDNMATAICAVHMAGFKLEKPCIKRAMQSVELFGRLQRISKGPLLESLPDSAEVWIDGGHNPDAAVVISKEISKFKRLDDQPFYLVIGMRSDKNYQDYLKAFVGLSPIVLTVPIMCSEDGSNPKSSDPELLMQEATRLGFKAFSCSSITEAFSKIKPMNLSLSSPIVLVTGSLYLVGEVLYKNEIYPS
ncbi:folylpolyglutamate synthase/dihydrofolate synthase family protein [Candidatus Liberibacter sp.]|uniref:bifunctional folylpolyglutamate synthase/dihydrofolate synthase n=1 Tax=Candidatus Liberibacter sp. TaxID=34022 RepID=UPI0015F3664F|nr:folylpolyglutamate synthase/dihydrofolate synthase family protein [Candidatus Liberibacter sp.]MBA5723978.1 bifunctional folylpolyglutamate synthase/dihydrofolate synthase [Candidatus Liberibacter sp.]